MAKIHVSGKPESYWIATTSKGTDFPKLEKEVEVDVAIVGGGMAGITAAYLLKQEGKKVALIEADKIGHGVTGNTSAKITSLHTLIYKYLIDHFGKEGAKQYAKAQESAIARIMEIIETEKINCDFVKADAYTYTGTKENISKLKEEAQVAKNLGLPASYTDIVPLPYPAYGAVKFTNQAHFHPLKYLMKLVEKIPGKGSYIFENTRIQDIKKGSPAEIIALDNKKIKAKYVIVTTNYPILNDGLYYARLTPSRSYVIAARISEHIPKGMFINIEEPLYSLRPQITEDAQCLIVTGFEHVTGQEEDTARYYVELEKMTRARFAVESVDFHWSTQDPVTIDGVPFIGKYTPDSENIFVATGFGGWGMTNGTAAAMILSDMILKRRNSWAPVFDPARYEQLKSVTNLLSQNVKVMENFVKGRFSGNEEDVNKLDKGDGKVFQIGKNKVAVYKDDAGNLHKVSAVCTHMGCVLHFNNAEASWDCPCHGSRFSTEGEVFHGPAIDPLKKIY